MIQKQRVEIAKQVCVCMSVCYCEGVCRDEIYTATVDVARSDQVAFCSENNLLRCDLVRNTELTYSRLESTQPFRNKFTIEIEQKLWKQVRRARAFPPISLIGVFPRTPQKPPRIMLFTHNPFPPEIRIAPHCETVCKYYDALKFLTYFLKFSLNSFSFAFCSMSQEVYDILMIMMTEWKGSFRNKEL